MIVVIFGPSGVGKTAAMEELVSRDYRLLECDMTRERRPGEVNKRNVSPTDFTRAVDAGAYAFVSRLYGNSYGLREAVVSNAAGSAERFLIDLPQEAIPALSPYAGRILGIALLFENAGVARRRLLQCGRPERLSEVLGQSAAYEAMFADAAELPSWVDPRPVRCGTTSVADIATEIDHRVRRFQEIAT